MWPQINSQLVTFEEISAKIIPKGTVTIEYRVGKVGLSPLPI